MIDWDNEELFGEKAIRHFELQDLRKMWALPSPGELEEKQREEQALQEQQRLVDEWNAEQLQGESYRAHPTLQKTAKWCRVSPRLPDGTRSDISQNRGPQGWHHRLSTLARALRFGREEP